MVYYSLYDCEAEAVCAVRKWIKHLRADWDLDVVEVSEVNPGLLAPGNRCLEAAGVYRPSEKVRREIDEINAVFGLQNRPQWGGGPLRGIQCTAYGPFARGDEPYAGEDQAEFWVAWPAGV